MIAQEQARPRVFVVDDDVSILKALSRLLGIAGYDVETYQTPQAFLDGCDSETPGCALFDVGLGDMDGLSLQHALVQRGNVRPIIFVTGCDDIDVGVRAMKSGAHDYLTKPIQEEALLSAVAAATEADRKSRETWKQQRDLKGRVDHLTPREREVMTLVVRGRLNKQIANDLGIVEKTVKVHRARVMEKLNVRTVAALVQSVLHLEGQ